MLFADIARNDLYSLLLRFDNGLADPEATFRMLKDSNLATSYTNFGELPSNNVGVYAVKTRNICRDSAAI